jgi:predicted phosphodiesterase
MNLQVLSDLHLEFLEPHELEFIDALDKEGVDVAVIAGDLCRVDFFPHAIKALCEQYHEVVYVAGNHEYYGTSAPRLHDLLASLHASLENFHWLRDSTVEVGGVRIAGTTLWFHDDPDNVAYEEMLNDFWLIRGFKPRVYEENARAVEFLEAELPFADVVVTHHLPSKRCIAPRFEGDSLNRFFLCDLDDLIASARPALWVHGHTHCSIDAQVGTTRIVCNPLGYSGCEENANFDRKLVVQVERRL